MLPKIEPTKVLKTNYMGRAFQINLYQTEDAAYLLDLDRGDIPFKLTPINTLGTLDITVHMRKAIRFLVGKERDSAKLTGQGFVFLEPPAPAHPKSTTPPKKSVSKPSGPKWL
jgi:hypothetical protein